jgi:hypothetical protein
MFVMKGTYAQHTEGPKNYEGYSESNLRWAVKNKHWEKTFIMYKKTYILKLLLNIVTAEIEAFVSGNKFLYACVK